MADSGLPNMGLILTLMWSAVTHGGEVTNASAVVHVDDISYYSATKKVSRRSRSEAAA
jgi:hypothetical protein